MIGEGMIAMDVCVFMAVTGAWMVHVYCLPSCWAYSGRLRLCILMRIAGWVMFSLRFGVVLMTVGDIAISIPSAIAVFFLSIGDVWGALVKRRENIKGMT